MRHLFLDARCEKVYFDGVVRDSRKAVSVSVGPDGWRSVIGMSAHLSEARSTGKPSSST